MSQIIDCLQQNNIEIYLKRFILYSCLFIGLVLCAISYISNTGLKNNFSVTESLLRKNSEQCSINSVRTESKDFGQKEEQPTIVEIQSVNEQPVSNNNFESKLLCAKNLTRLQFVSSSIEYFIHSSFQQLNGHYLYFLCKILI